MSGDDESSKDAGFETFRAVIAEYFELPLEIVTKWACFDDDLGLDSLAFFECLVMLEEAAGHELDLESIATVRTIGDLFNFYLQFSGDEIAQSS